jgi:predicted transcriptional regulator
LDLSRLAELTRAFLDRLEDYQRRAAAGGFRVTVGATGLWMHCPPAAVAIEAELSRLGLGAEPALATTSGRGLVTIVNDLRFLLFEMRGWDEAGWGVSVPAAGLWGAVSVGSRGLPDLTPWLGQLRLLADDLAAAAAAPPDGDSQGGQDNTPGTDATEAEVSPEPPWIPQEAAILMALLRANGMRLMVGGIMSRIQIDKTTGESIRIAVNLGEKTVRKYLRSLQERGLIERPTPKGGVCLTEAGSRLARGLPPDAGASFFGVAPVRRR